MNAVLRPDNIDFRILLLAHLIQVLKTVDKPISGHDILPPDQIERLRTLSASDVVRLAASRLAVVGITIDTSELRTGLHNLRSAAVVEALEDEFLKAGASPEMMMVLFTMSYRAVLKRRRRLGLQRRRGRFEVPSVELRDRIHQAWAQLRDYEVRERYLNLHRAFPQISLEVLQWVIREFGE